MESAPPSLWRPLELVAGAVGEVVDTVVDLVVRPGNDGGGQPPAGAPGKPGCWGRLGACFRPAARGGAGEEAGGEEAAAAEDECAGSPCLPCAGGSRAARKSRQELRHSSIGEDILKELGVDEGSKVLEFEYITTSGRKARITVAETGGPRGPDGGTPAGSARDGPPETAPPPQASLPRSASAAAKDRVQRWLDASAPSALHPVDRRLPGGEGGGDSGAESSGDEYVDAVEEQGREEGGPEGAR